MEQDILTDSTYTKKTQDFLTSSIALFLLDIGDSNFISNLSKQLDRWQAKPLS